MDMPSRELELIAVVRELVRELSPQRLKRGDVTLASRLDRDLGIDSLGRTELVLRIERKFHVRLAVALNSSGLFVMANCVLSRTV